MSSESDAAWRLARFYGPTVCRQSRVERVAFLRQRIIDLETTMQADRIAHKANCDDCKRGEFCVDAFAHDSRHSEVRRLQGFVWREEQDRDYADRARTIRVDYKQHVDGFCNYWQNVRHRLFVIADHRCQRCRERHPLEAHHRHYETLGFEEVADLEALCARCHKQADHQRAYDAGLATYASKKYGDRADDIDTESLEEEFDRWLEDHDDED